MKTFRSKVVVIAIAIIIWTGMAFAQNPHNQSGNATARSDATAVGIGIGGDSSATATGGSVGDIGVYSGDVTVQTKIGQTISPQQSIEINSERPLLNLPVAIPNIIPDLQFGNVTVVKSIVVDARLKDIIVRIVP